MKAMFQSVSQGQVRGENKICRKIVQANINWRLLVCTWDRGVKIQLRLRGKKVVNMAELLELNFSAPNRLR